MYKNCNRSTTIKLQNILSSNKRLEEIHTAQKNACKTFKKQIVEEYEEKLKDLKEYIQLNDIEEFKKAMKTVEKWEDEIKNMFQYSISNGAVERINRTA